MMKRSRKTLIPILVFFITLALGGTAVFVAQKIKGPKITEEPPKKFAKAPEGAAPAPTTPTETEAATPANTCNSTDCECAFTATAAPTKPSCSLLSISPTEGLANQEFTASITCQSGSTAFQVIYLITRKRGTTTKVRLTPDTLCTGSGACTKSFKFTPSATTRGLPTITEAGTYDVWITARSVGPDGVGGNDDDLACTDIPDDLREPTSPAACGQKGKSFVIKAPSQGPACTTLSLTPTTGNKDTTFTASVTCTSGSTALARLYLLVWKTGMTDSTNLNTGNGLCFGQTTCNTTHTFKPSAFNLTADGTYNIWLAARTPGADGQVGTADDGRCSDAPQGAPGAEGRQGVPLCGASGKTFQISNLTHTICQSGACVSTSGTGTDQCQTNADCQGNQKPSCGRLEAVPTAGTAPIKVTFTANGASDPDGTLATYEFDFGDESGTTVSSNSTAHTYQTAGSFEARVWVRDNLSLRSDMTDFCKVKITIGSAGAPAPAPTPTPPPPGPISTTTPVASPSAAPTGSREMTVLVLLSGLMAILLGGWWYARLDPAWQKFEKGLTRFWERK